METLLYDSSGGSLGLNFLNTQNWIHSGEPEEMLNRYDDFLLWSFEAGVISADEREVLSARAAADPAQAALALRAIHEIRSALYKIIARLIEAQQPDPRDLERFNMALKGALSHRRIEFASPAMRWTFQAEPLPFEYPLWPVLLAAADFLASTDTARVHMCANPTCGWVFLDRSRNGTRKWCSSTSCGNRLRVRQYYARKR